MWDLYLIRGGPTQGPAQGDAAGGEAGYGLQVLGRAGEAPLASKTVVVQVRGRGGGVEEGRGEDQARSLINQAADRQDITRGYICRQPRAI